jgi:DNA-binding transcriptional MocR family regulator
LLEPSASPIANLIPERSYLAVSLSKCIAPALRVSYLVVPNVASEQLMGGSLQATMQMPPPLMVALVTHWLRSGVADQIVTAIRNEATGRQQLAAKILKGLSFAGKSGGHHLWLSLPDRWTRSDFVSRLLRDGLAVVGSETFAVDGGAAPRAVRIALGAARNRAELSSALHVLAAAMKAPETRMPIV